MIESIETVCKYDLDMFIENTNTINFRKPYIESIIDDNTLKYKYDWLSEACKGGNEEIVDYVISKGNRNFNRGLFGACLGGHLSLVEKMIKKGAEINKYYGTVLEYAELGRNEKVLEFIKNY